MGLNNVTNITFSFYFGINKLILHNICKMLMGISVPTTSRVEQQRSLPGIVYSRNMNAMHIWMCLMARIVAENRKNSIEDMQRSMSRSKERWVNGQTYRVDKDQYRGKISEGQKQQPGCWGVEERRQLTAFDFESV